MTKKAAAIHLVCRDRKNVSNEDETAFTSGVWRLTRKHLKPGLVVALHARRAEASYLQGTLEDFTSDKKRVSLRVKRITEPLAWSGRGTGEKGYAYGSPEAG